jgi:hypothetical protein
MDETFFAVPVTLWQSCLTPVAGDIAVFFGGVLFLATQFAVCGERTYLYCHNSLSLVLSTQAINVFSSVIDTSQK